MNIAWCLHVPGLAPLKVGHSYSDQLLAFGKLKPTRRYVVDIMLNYPVAELLPQGGGGGGGLWRGLKSEWSITASARVLQL